MSEPNKWMRWAPVAVCVLVGTVVEVAHGYGDEFRATHVAQGAVLDAPFAEVKSEALPDGVPMHVRDELAFIVRHIDEGKIPTAREHWRKLLRAEASAGRAGKGEEYVNWIMAHAYRDELSLARKSVAMNRFYSEIEAKLRTHLQDMKSLRTKLKPGEVRVVRTVTHVPAYRETDTPPARPVFAPRQLDRDALDQYLSQLQRQIGELGHEEGLDKIDLAAAQAKESALHSRIEEVAAQLHEDAVVASSSGH